ncbi:MAG TPA: TetR/AcrR family transcriptional regulator [Chloroflexota bacterium]|nr:TetR/AcrR family transcriptional regulator [Chloroflexota bacterium]
MSRPGPSAAGDGPGKLTQLPRGRHALTPEEVAKNQRERIFAALAKVVSERGYQGASVARISAVAGVSTRSFYGQFADKTECFLLLHELYQERLFAAVKGACEDGGELPEMVRRSLAAGLRLLASEPVVAQLLTLEAPAAGGQVTRRHFEWLRCYAALLAEGAARLPAVRRPSSSAELTIVGGIASRIAASVLAEQTDGLPQMSAELSEVVLAFYGASTGAGEAA